MFQVQDLHLARLQKEQKVSALEWKLMDAQANIVVLQAERDSLQRQVDQALQAKNSSGLGSSPVIRSAQPLYSNLPVDDATLSASMVVCYLLVMYSDLVICR